MTRTGLHRLLAVVAFSVLSTLTADAQAASQSAGNFSDLVSKQTPYVDVRAFGAKCDSKTPDDAAINTAAQAAARSGGTLFVPSGMTCEVANTVMVNSNMMAAGATLSTHSDIVVLRVGNRTTELLNKTLWLPNTRNLAKRWSGTVSTGVEILNADSCRIMEGNNVDFLIGTKITAFNEGMANNTVFIGREENDKIGYLLKVDDPEGWINQNTFYGGRIGLYSGECLAPGLTGTVVSGSRIIKGLSSTARLHPGMRVLVGLADPAQSPAPTFPDSLVIASVDSNSQITVSGKAEYSGTNVPLIFPVPGSRHLVMTTNAHVLNNNQFIGLNVEGECTEYQAELHSVASNTFQGVRWESEVPRVKITGTSARSSQGNMWINGLYVWLLQVWDDANTESNSIEDSYFHTLIGRGGRRGLLTLGISGSDSNTFNTFPLITILPPRWSQLSQDHLTHWTAQLRSASFGMKGSSDGFERIRMNFANGCLAFGDGAHNLDPSADPNAMCLGVSSKSKDLGLSGANLRLDQTGKQGWNGSHLLLGDMHIWNDNTQHLRYKMAAPSSDSDGSLINADITLPRGANGISAGRITLSRGEGAHQFTSAYDTAPVCTATDQTSSTAVHITATSKSLNVFGNGSDTVAWICAPSNN